MTYCCDRCGYRTAKWMGFCPQCKTSGALSESHDLSVGRGSGAALVAQLHERRPVEPARCRSQVGEFDRALGGGLVPGSVVVVGGEPGIGKSTLLLQVAAGSSEDGPSMFVSAEESVEQVAMRAGRLGLDAPNLLVASETSVERIVAALEAHRPRVAIIDSIQTVRSDLVEGLAGGITQVRESAARFVAAARRLQTAIVLVGHVTKDGNLAGPKLLEHMVDAVCSLEGDEASGLRFVRPLKNRFGSIDHSGIFEMTDQGLVGVPDPSRLFTEARRTAAAGTVLYPMVQGRRVLLVEVQALVAATSSPQPRRSVKGLDGSRVQQLLAVLARHAGVDLARHEVYVGIAGGLRVQEPAVDLPIALALASSLLDVPMSHVAAWGEVGLTGELRAVAHGKRRRAEAERLGIGSMVSAVPGELQTLSAALFVAGLVDLDVPVSVA